MTFVGAMRRESNLTVTENQATTYKSSLSSVLDLFASGGALRKRTPKEIHDIVRKAALEDLLLTFKCLFYLRDIRGGQGERRTFREGIKVLANEFTEEFTKNIHLIPEFGRWDDVLALEGTKLENVGLELIKTQLIFDITSETPSLMAKWLPSENASSKETKRLAAKVSKFIGGSPRDYRKLLSSLRHKIDVVERKLCANKWGEIKYPNVPSNASLKYRKAFERHDRERYRAFLDQVKAGKVEIKAKTLYPYDIVREIMYKHTHDDTLEAQWKALPDFFNGKFESALVLADVSGSMSGLPMAVSISLALYISERCKGPFHNLFMTFSADPEIHEIRGDSLAAKVQNIQRTKFGLNTNLQRAFDKILDLALKTNASQEEMPKTLYIISDMEFDQARGLKAAPYGGETYGETNWEVIKEKFRNAGYEMPMIVFWNVQSRNDQQPVIKHDSGALLCSGCSPAILKYVLNKEFRTPLDGMLEVLNSERYSKITV